jgi:hypothetical protein
MAGAAKGSVCANTLPLMAPNAIATAAHTLFNTAFSYFD